MKKFKKYIFFIVIIIFSFFINCVLLPSENKKIGYKSWESHKIYRKNKCYIVYINGSQGIILPCEKENE